MRKTEEECVEGCKGYHSEASEGAESSALPSGHAGAPVRVHLGAISLLFAFSPLSSQYDNQLLRRNL